jgi:hypothetical protein
MPIQEGVKPAPAKEKTFALKPLVFPGQRFVARQPILDRSQNVFGYEILSSAIAKQLKLTDEEVGTTWWLALQWAQEATSGV